MRILIIEDEKDMNSILVKKLTAEGYNVDTCYDGQAAVDYLMAEQYDGAVLDVMLPKLDGFEVLRTIRGRGNQTPVLLLSARDKTTDIVSGLGIGADDYMVKPFAFDELIARLKVITRRKVEVRENLYRCGDLVLDVNTHMVSRGEHNIELSPREYSILEYLVRNKNILVSRDQIASNIWNLDYSGNSNVVDVYIRYLRKKIDDPFENKMIQTIRGAGYKLVCDE